MTRFDTLTSNVKSMVHISDPSYSGSCAFFSTPNATIELQGVYAEDGSNMVISLSASGASVTHNGKTATVTASMSEVVEVFVLKNAVRFVCDGRFYLVGVDRVYFDPYGETAIVTPLPGETTKFALVQLQDEFLATYLETDNTIIGGIASLLADRPALVDVSGDYLRATIVGDDKPITIRDAKAINIKEQRSKPSRGIVFAEDVIPFDIGGSRLGTTPINIKCNATPGWYGKKWARLNLNAKVSFVVLNGNYGLDDVKIGDTVYVANITRQGKGRETVGGVQIVVTSNSVTINDGGTRTSISGVVIQ